MSVFLMLLTFYVIVYNTKPVHTPSYKTKEKRRTKSMQTNNVTNDDMLTNNLMSSSKICCLIFHYVITSFTTNYFSTKPCKRWKKTECTRKHKRKPMQLPIEKSSKNDHHQRPYFDYIPITPRML